MMGYTKYHRKIFSENEHLLSRVPFIFFVIVGAIVLSIMKMNNISQTLVSSASVSLIVLYAMVVWFTPILRLREDNIGDNCYYLGFIYTLGSLIWALYAFAESQKVNEIIANFGLALFSTVAGILLRVMISQTRKDVLETDRECRIELSSATSRMRAKIDESVLALDTFCRATQQMTEECIRDNTKKSTEAIDACISKINITAEAVLNIVTDTSKVFEKSFSKVNDSIQAIEGELIGTAKKINAIQIPPDLISKQLEPATTNISSVLEDLSVQMKKHNEEIMQEVHKSKSMTKHLANTLSELTDSLTDKIQ